MPNIIIPKRYVSNSRRSVVDKYEDRALICILCNGVHDDYGVPILTKCVWSRYIRGAVISFLFFLLILHLSGAFAPKAITTKIFNSHFNITTTNAPFSQLWNRLSRIVRKELDPETLSLAKLLDAHNLTSSHQFKLFSLDHRIQNYSHERLFATSTEQYGGYVLTDKFAYLHIFKNGGTTIGAQVKPTQPKHSPLSSFEMSARTWITFVRDPIAHFFSGWQECMARRYNQKYNRGISFQRSISEWLDVLRSNRFHPVKCQPHSYPQLNFMLNATKLYQNLKLVAALEEMKDVLLMVGFPFNDEFGHVRKSATSLNKLAYYRIQIDMLSNDTLLDICDFLALDYCFLDFKPPDICMSLVNKICNGEIS